VEALANQLDASVAVKDGYPGIAVVVNHADLKDSTTASSKRADVV
jgi:hypothetical protein